MKLPDIHHWFIPHRETHQKAHLLRWHFLVIYLLLFILLRVGFDLISYYQPGVLGLNSQITVEEIVAQTNEERAKSGLSPVAVNEKLNQAAALKAQNMFAENYWAHFAPSGKDPWGFILSSGYKFSYAGENLARNFYNSEDVVRAWMNSPTHKDNIVNKNYREIGVAVVDGVLLGQKTTLVVQMFGSEYLPIASLPQVNVSGTQIDVPKEEVVASRPVLAIGTPQEVRPALIDPFVVSKGVGLTLILVIGVLLLADFLILRHRGVFRLSSNHFAHMSLLALAGTSLLTGQPGSIL